MIQQQPYWPVDKLLLELLKQIVWILFTGGGIALAIYILFGCVKSIHRRWLIARGGASEPALRSQGVIAPESRQFMFDQPQTNSSVDRLTADPGTFTTLRGNPRDPNWKR